MRATRTIRTHQHHGTTRSWRRVLALAVAPILFAGSAFALSVVGVTATAPASGAVAEGPDTMPFIGTFELWCSWNNPSIYNNCSGYHPTPALDVGMPRGTAIYAAGPGIVVGAANGCVETDWSCQSYQGNFVAIQHPNGIYSRYLHLTNSVVSVNQAVARGQLIGYSGATGSVCQPTPCPHLHYDELDNYNTVHRVDPGPTAAMVGGSSVSYPQQVGVSSWNQAPYGTLLTNEGFQMAPAPSAGFHSLVPYRALDSRTSTGGWGGKLGPGQSRDLHVTGGSIPDSATAVVVNVTATNATAPSFLTVYPSGAPLPTASNLNFGAPTVPNLVVARIGQGGNIAIYNAQGDVDVIADVVGFFDDGTGGGDRFVGLSPTRILDSRDGTGGWTQPLASGESRSLLATGVGVPATASSVVMNVTVTDGTANSFVKAYPSDAPLPITSNLNFATGQTVSNLVVSRVAGDGTVALYNESGSVDVVVDIVGYFDPYASGGHYHALAPARVLDNRTGTGGYSTPWNEGTARPVTLVGVGGVPADATAVVLNLTATNGDAGSFLTAYPAGSGAPMASNLLFGPYDTVPNLVMVPIGAGGAIEIFNQKGNVDVVADVVGYVSAG